MRAPRLFQPGPLATGETVALTPTAAAHVTRVLRLRPGDALVLFDGRGGEYAARLTAIGRDGVTAAVLEHHAREVESPLAVTLLMGLARGERMDFALQKATELGVARIVPVVCARSVVHFDAARAAKRLEHWGGVVVAACEQCGRNRVPAVEPVITFEQALSRPRAPRALVLDPAEGEALRGLARPAEAVVELLIGPEGGLNAAEREAARAAGFTPVRLGPRVLRTETAAAAALAALQALWGDVG
ncbi:MAG TPA: 16S rRNA (uracil(1498)-N(3))-methyltransferase [Gammaproteobacteria bacterium]|nr:16S rRNA (uracil(1498)-N(3))-methyltransferase [Gammaproteobacteria bacterium]